MLVIRLQRTGRENDPTYRVVVAEKARPVKSKFLEIVGHYLPARKPSVFVHKSERIQFWVGKGAIPSDTVARLLKNSGMQDMEKYIQRYAKKKSKKEPPAAAAPAPAAPAAEPAKTEEAPAPVAEAAPTEPTTPEAASA